jgi:hypothetical protein
MYLNFSSLFSVQVCAEPAVHISLEGQPLPPPEQPPAATSTKPQQHRSRRGVTGGTGLWTNAQLSAAIRDVERDTAIRTIARFHQIPTSSLRDHITGIRRRENEDDKVC